MPNIDAYSFPLVLPQNSLRTKQHFFIALQDSDDLKTEEKKKRRVSIRTANEMNIWK